jgi:hypothetical protein
MLESRARPDSIELGRVLGGTRTALAGAQVLPQHRHDFPVIAGPATVEPKA